MTLLILFLLHQVEQLLQKSEKGHVIATCRKPNEASGLLLLKNMFAERLSILPLDVTNESTIEVIFLHLSVNFSLQL